MRSFESILYLSLKNQKNMLFEKKVPFYLKKEATKVYKSQVLVFVFSKNQKPKVELWFLVGGSQPVGPKDFCFLFLVFRKNKNQNPSFGFG